LEPVSKGESVLGILIIVAFLIIALGAVDAASIAWGEDSRDDFPNDHHH
jgi:hypothetical protein